MILIPFSILALAAGVYLLVYIKQAGLGGLYKYLAWLVVLLSLLFIVCTVVREARHHKHMSECQASGHCNMSGHGDGASCPYMKSDHGDCSKGAEGCSKEGAETKACCKKGVEENKPACCTKDGEAGKAACCTKGASDAAKPACCSKGGTKAAADSTAKK